MKKSKRYSKKKGLGYLAIGALCDLITTPYTIACTMIDLVKYPFKKEKYED